MTSVESPGAEPDPAARRVRLTRAEGQALTRRRIMVAAADVFAEKGIRAASLAEVADRAGYTIGAVYSNFAGKDELVQAIMSDGLDRFERSLAASFAEMHDASSSWSHAPDDLIERELDRMAAAEDAVPGRWWRVLYEYRTYTAAEPAGRAQLADSERRIRA